MLRLNKNSFHDMGLEFDKHNLDRIMYTSHAYGFTAKISGYLISPSGDKV